MAYQVTFTTTFANSAPEYDVWVGEQTSSIFPDELLAAVNGKTPKELLDEMIVIQTNPADGFVSTTSNREGDVTTTVEVWESQEAFDKSREAIVKEAPSGTISTDPGSTIVTGSGTSFTSDVAVGNDIAAIIDGTPIRLGAVTLITNDTSLTIDYPNLDINTAITGATYHVKTPKLPTDFIYQTYSNTYIVSVDITYANI